MVSLSARGGKGLLSKDCSLAGSSMLKTSKEDDALRMVVSGWITLVFVMQDVFKDLQVGGDSSLPILTKESNMHWASRRRTVSHKSESAVRIHLS